MNEWNIKQLAAAMERDLLLCHTATERAMVQAICGKEIRETAERFAKQRKLTPGEVAIASQYGYRQPMH